MRKTVMMVFLALAVICAAVPVYAQGSAPPASNKDWAVPLGAVIGMGLAAGLCGLGQGRATASAAEAMARNPGARPAISFITILGLALIESLALYTLVIVFFKT
jgi:F-type H+-transporting ATPase subunit c